MSHRTTAEVEVDLDGFKIKAEAVYKIFGYTDPQGQLDEVLSLQDYDPSLYGDGDADLPVYAGEDILHRLPKSERARLEELLESNRKYWIGGIYEVKL